MSIYIEMINLGRAEDRRTHMRAALAKAEISADFHPAVDAQSMAEEEIYSYVRREGPWGYVHPAAAACSLSHMRVWQRFLATDKSHCLILEDDIHMAADLSQWIKDLRWWPAGADIVKLERWRARTLKVLLDQEGTQYLGRRIARLRNRHVGAAGYILTRHAAQVLLAHTPMPLVVDNLLFNLNASPAARSLSIYQIQPALIEQGNEPPGWIKPPVAKYRPTGWLLLRQKLKRAYFEVAYPLSTWIKFITGTAKLEQITYAQTARRGGTPTHLHEHPDICAEPAQRQK